MAVYYTVSLIGDGLTTETAFRPDVPEGVRWACVSHDPKSKTMVIATDTDGLDVKASINPFTVEQAAAASKEAVTVEEFRQSTDAWLGVEPAKVYDGSKLVEAVDVKADVAVEEVQVRLR